MMSLKHIVLVLLIAIAACGKKGNERSLDEEYSLAPDSKEVFGAYAAQELAAKIFPNLEVTKNRRPFDGFYEKFTAQTNLSDNHLYLLVTPGLNIRKSELEALKEFIRTGNTVVIVTDEVGELFAEEFRMVISDARGGMVNFNSSRYTDTWLQMKDSTNFAGQRYGFYHEPLSRFIEADPHIGNIYTLGTNQYNQPDYIQLRLGRGRLFLHTNARSFSNYFLLSNNNFQYLLAAAAYWPAYPQSITWDDFYHRNIYRRPEGRSAFAALLGIQQLRWALLILMALCAIWILSNLRRKQKMIPVVAPNKNSSVEFAETIARLYFNQKDNQNIAHKIGTYFQDYLQRNFYLPPGIRESDWPGIIAGKTMLNINEASQLQALIQKANQGKKLSDEELLNMHWLTRKAMDSKKA